MSEKTAIKLDEEVIIPSCGYKAAGTVVTKAEAGDSYEWLLKNEKGHLVSDQVQSSATKVTVGPEVVEDDDADQDVDGESTVSDEGEVVNEQTPVVSEDDAAVIGTVKELLAQGKMHLKTIVQQTGFTEEVVSPLLTEANGFRKNQQGWFSNI